MSILFAATYPERTPALVLYGSMPRFVWAPRLPAAGSRSTSTCATPTNWIAELGDGRSRARLPARRAQRATTEEEVSVAAPRRG